MAWYTIWDAASTHRRTSALGRCTAWARKLQRRRIALGLRKLRDKQLENPWKKHDNIPL